MRKVVSVQHSEWSGLVLREKFSELQHSEWSVLILTEKQTEIHREWSALKGKTLNWQLLSLFY